MTQQELQDRFEIPGILRFGPGNGELMAAHITAPAAQATIYFQGAHLTHWQPAGQAPVLFTSSRSEFTAGKAIRGGVPVIFPWFGERHDGNAGPSHGFARISEWQLAFAAISGDALHLMWTLEPNELSRLLGFNAFKVGYRMSIGRTLTLELTVANDSGSSSAMTPEEMQQQAAPFSYEAAFHTYYEVADARQVSVDGLADTEYIDKVDAGKRKRQDEAVLHLSGRTDRPYLNTDAACVLNDPAGQRRIVVQKSGSNSTVVWNPWAELCAKMPDMTPEGWQRFVCVETANVGENAITLAPGAVHSMRAEISVEALA
jgi:glucose-6-phosphate 1-epimerase